MRRVVVTGLGAITPLGKNLEDTWNALANGVSGAELITHFDTEKFKTKFACEVKDYNPQDYSYFRNISTMSEPLPPVLPVKFSSLCVL